MRASFLASDRTYGAMLDRFTGSQEVKAKLAAGVPLGRTGRPEESR